MFDLLKLVQKKEELLLAFYDNLGDCSDSFRNCYGCQGDCSGNCTGTCEGCCADACMGECYGACDGTCGGVGN